MSDAEWEPFRPDIERLYCYENKTLNYVLEYMERMYDFKKSWVWCKAVISLFSELTRENSKQQYQRQLKKWGLSKNQVKEKDWKTIVQRAGKRKRNDNKESEVHFCGVQRKIKKAEYRDGYVSTINNFAGNILIQTFAESFADLFQAPSPSTPEGVIICTPVSPGMRLEWNTSLPWLRFRELVRPDISQSMNLNNYRFLF